MAKKKLILNGSATRRFMKLATIKPTYVSNFLKEQEEDEMDMLDLAFGLTQTSRLGCQIELSDKLDGLRVTIPEDL